MNPFRLHKKGYLREAFPKKKVLKEYPFGIGDETEDPATVTEAGTPPFKKDAAKDPKDPKVTKGASFAGGNAGGDSADVALKMQEIEQQKEDEEQAKREQQMAADRAEQERIGQMRAEADQAVADDLTGKFSDAPDKVEFWPTLESFGEYRKK